MSKRRVIAALEIVGVIAILSVDLPVPAPIVVLIAASVSLWARGVGWGGVGLRLPPPNQSSHIALGLFAGAAAAIGLTMLGLADENVPPAVSESVFALVVVILLQVAFAFAAEMVYRGYLIQRIKDVAGAGTSSVLAVIVAAAVFAWGAGGGLLLGFVGAMCAGTGYGFLYLAAGERLGLGIAFHAGFLVAGVLIVGGGLA